MNKWLHETIVMLDTETTGLHEGARIVQMASVTGHEGKIVRGRVMLIDPGEPIPPKATEIHGITDEQVKGKPAFADIAGNVLARIESGLPAAYNAPFDQRMFAFELGRLGLELSPVVWIDPLPWVRKIDKFKKSKKLVDACRRRDIPVRAHDALGDAVAALQLLYAIAPQLPSDLEELRGETERLRDEQEKERLAYHARREALGVQP